MSDESATIKLGSKEYTVYPFTVGEFRRIAKILKNGDPVDTPLDILGIALKRSTPPVEDIESMISPPIEDIRTAVDIYIKLGGLAKADGNPPAGGE